MNDLNVIMEILDTGYGTLAVIKVYPLILECALTVKEGIWC